ncbi:MAG: helix-turn-helix domain-containing protein [Candidatus Norongarragalinales archaeon]
MYELHADDIQRFIETLRKHKWVKEIRVIEKTRSHALAFIRSKHDTLMIETIARTRSAPLEPTLTREGKDTVAILVPDERALRALSSTLRDDFEIQLKYKKTLEPGVLSKFNARDFMRMQIATSGLSEKQREAFLLATKRGYWNTPKRVDIAELARESGVDEATFSEHLRKAEAKLMPLLAELMNKTNPEKPNAKRK